MEVRFFGEFEAVEAGVPVPVRGTKQRAVLALLALQRGGPVSADRLIDVLWGDEQIANAANALQAQIGQLRRTLGATAIVTSEAGYALDVGPDDLDAARFEQLVAKGRRLLEEGETALASSTLREALQLRRGEPLSEFAYAGFADAERAHLDDLTLVAIEARAEADLVLGHHGELVGELEALCREHPLRERLWELLMLALYRAGRQAEALRAYSKARDHLVDELGIDPGPALRQLEARILAQDPSLAAVGPARLQTAAAPMATGNLRERLSSFVGRSAELEELKEVVRSSRLVTLIGPGGVGKTRLALETATTLREEHPDGAWLVDLAGVTEAEGVAPAVAGTLGAAAAGLTGPLSPSSTVELIVRYLAGRSLLVVLDNCEHVIAEAASLAETLVGALPGLRLVATSREPLAVPGEVLVPVRTLATLAATELFVDRARAVRPGFTAGRAHPCCDQRHLSAAGRPSPGRRARRRPPSFTYGGDAGGAARRPLSSAHRGRPHGSAPPANPSSGGGLELRPAVRRRTPPVRAAVGLRRGLRPGGGRGGLCRRPGPDRRDPRRLEPAGRQVPRLSLRRRW